MQVIRTSLPKNSSLYNPHDEYDYEDSFLASLYDPQERFTSVDIGKAFFSSGPEWVGKLFSLRNKLMSKFGLKTAGDMSNRESQLKDFNCDPGEQLGLFKVFAKSENEVILGEDDKHLNFRISLLLEDQERSIEKRNLTISTTVIFNNWFGRLYFLPVKPFHKFIVPAILRGIINKLEKQNYPEH